MKHTTRLSTRGRVLLPLHLRRAKGWVAGTEFTLEDVGDGVLLRPVESHPTPTMDEILGSAGYTGPRRSLEEMEAAVVEEARRRR